MEMVANTLHLDQVGRVPKRSASPRILTHFVEGFVIQESNYPFTVSPISIMSGRVTSTFSSEKS